jgi:hypothetical protein
MKAKMVIVLEDVGSYLIFVIVMIFAFFACVCQAFSIGLLLCSH